MDLALLEAQYGFVTPKKVLEALQWDAFQAKSAPWQDDIYEKPMTEVCTISGVCTWEVGQVHKLAKHNAWQLNMTHNSFLIT